MTLETFCLPELPANNEKLKEMLKLYVMAVKLSGEEDVLIKGAKFAIETISKIEEFQKTEKFKNAAPAKHQSILSIALPKMEFLKQIKTSQFNFMLKELREIVDIGNESGVQYANPETSIQKLVYIAGSFLGVLVRMKKAIEGINPIVNSDDNNDKKENEETKT